MLSELSDKILKATSKGASAPALLVLEDGTALFGRACGASGETFGEICFNTSLEGYLEVVTDPSYAGQIVTMTYPQIGNYGVSLDDVQRTDVHMRGLVVHDMCPTPSNWRSEVSLPEFLKGKGIVAIEGIDTRALVRCIREKGAMKAGISTSDLDPTSLHAKVISSESLVGVNFVEGVSNADEAPRNAYPASQSFALDGKADGKSYRVVAFDCGAKDAILQNLARCGCEVVTVPWDCDPADVLAMSPDGVFLSNGPGDPDAVAPTYDAARKLIGKVAMFGICLGHQMLSVAAGAEMEKLKYGHRGGNHPVMNLLTGRVEITAQNHGFSQVFETLGPIVSEESGGFADHESDLRVWVERKVAPVVMNPHYGRIQLTHVNLNDGTPEGMAFLDVPAFSVQYHPEASPGPTDSHYLFTAFCRLMNGDENYLDIDIAQDRLAGWSF